VNCPEFLGDFPVWFQAPAFIASTAVPRLEMGISGRRKLGTCRPALTELPVARLRTPRASS
jgi:hypothetical protein